MGTDGLTIALKVNLKIEWGSCHLFRRRSKTVFSSIDAIFSLLHFQKMAPRLFLGGLILMTYGFLVDGGLFPLC